MCGIIKTIDSEIWSVAWLVILAVNFEQITTSRLIGRFCGFRGRTSGRTTCWGVILKNDTITAKLCTSKLSGWLIMNLTSDFRNSKWRTQYGGHNILETQRFSWNLVIQGFWGRWLRIRHQIFGIQNGGPNIKDIIFWESNDFRGTLYSKVSEVADCEFNIGFPFFELAGPIWWTWNFGNSTIFA